MVYYKCVISGRPNLFYPHKTKQKLKNLENLYAYKQFKNGQCVLKICPPLERTDINILWKSQVFKIIFNRVTTKWKPCIECLNISIGLEPMQNICDFCGFRQVLNSRRLQIKIDTTDFRYFYITISEQLIWRTLYQIAEHLSSIKYKFYPHKT